MEADALVPVTWIPAGRHDPEPPTLLSDLVRGLSGASARAGVRTSDGGIRRADVVDALRSALEAAEVAVRDAYFDALDLGRRIGVRVEAGRANTNNEAVLAVLEAAKDDRISYLVLAVPGEYKGQPLPRKWWTG